MDEIDTVRVGQDLISAPLRDRTLGSRFLWGQTPADIPEVEFRIFLAKEGKEKWLSVFSEGGTGARAWIWVWEHPVPWLYGTRTWTQVLQDWHPDGCSPPSGWSWSLPFFVQLILYGYTESLLSFVNYPCFFPPYRQWLFVLHSLDFLTHKVIPFTNTDI